MVFDRGRSLIGSRYRRALSRTAVSAAAAGLPVVPGAWWSAAEGRFDCDLSGCGRTGPHPAVRNESPIGLPGLGAGLSGLALHDPDVVAARWRRQPYAVLVPTGDQVDVVDVPAALGRELAAQLDAHSLLGPVIAAGPRWFFLTAPGGRLSASGDVLVHGVGSWIMLPPSLGPGGERAGWLAPPVRGPRSGWALPSRDDVVAGLFDSGRRSVPGRAVSVPAVAASSALVPTPRRQVSRNPV